ncbi:hypothetical protein [Jutongia huaianensis]|uniref:DUF5610 domain-containing protein n=1 Tax=Jutongia huaianensis TaxID=2763668 RepID=A0ABR7N6D3_9FIRM|nr:hypothetical protein [Jutongia huaianensis]MBC8563528.1 hypothetical protein [Jutongia huaianensis]
MSISSINGVNGYTAVKTAETEKASKAAETTEKQVRDDGVVFEKSNETKKDSANQIYNKDNVIAKLKADQQSRLDSMNSLVQKLLGKQAEKFDLANGSNLAETFRQVAGKVDQQTIDEAKASVAEDGYWGVNQTSDRLVSMAIALAGGDTDKADTMMAAIEKGYKQATKAWGEDLPQICQDTMDATRQKMDDWKNGVTTAEDYSKYLS